jgi:hypothetical protein
VTDALASVAVTTVPKAGTDPWPTPPLLAHLVDDTSLLAARAAVPPMDVVVARYLDARDGKYGGTVGNLACPVSRLPALVKELARVGPARPVELALVVDTGLGAVPKALSTALSRPGLVTPRTVETSAPPDVDAVWLDRVAEFVPEDVVAVVEPRRPAGDDPDGTEAWLDAVRRVADQGCAPKLRCGGPRPSDAPSTEDVERFVRLVAGAGRGFTALGLSRVVRDAGPGGHGILNLLVAVARALGGGDVAAALRSTDGAALAAEIGALPERAVVAVRGLLARCGADADPAPGSTFAGLGLLAR